MTRYLLIKEIYINVSILITSPLISYSLYRLAMGYADRKIREAEGQWEPYESNLIKFLKGVGIYVLINLLGFIISGNFYDYTIFMSQVNTPLVVLCFIKLYLRMGKANYLTITNKVNPDHVKDVSNGEILGYIAATQALTHIIMHKNDKNKK